MGHDCILTYEGGLSWFDSMPRTALAVIGGCAYHVLNRANGRLRLFKKAADFQAFERVLAEAFGTGKGDILLLWAFAGSAVWVER